jgi:amino acid adenylation domain-containing protein
MSSTSSAGFRLSPEQARLWQHIASGRVLNSQILLKLHSTVDTGSLQSALNTLRDRFEILRTVFPSSKERKLPLQVVTDSRPISIHEHVVDSSHGVDEIAQLELNTRFDHESRDLWRVALVTEGTQQYVCLTATSMILDSGSLSALAGTLGELLSGKVADDEVLQYPQIAEWQHELVSEAEEEIVTFWNRYEPDFELNPSITFTGSGSKEHELKIRKTKVGTKTTSAIRQLAETLETDLSGLSALILAEFVARYDPSDQLHITITDPVRGFDELRNVIGNLSQSIPWTFGKNTSTAGLSGSIQALQSIREYSLYYNSDRTSTPKGASTIGDIEIHLSIESTVSNSMDILHVVSSRGTTGIQFSVIDYGKDFTLQLLADTSVVSEVWLDELQAQISDFFTYFVTSINDSWQHGSWLSISEQQLLLQQSGVKVTSSAVPLLAERLQDVFAHAAPQMALMQGMKWMNFKQLHAASEQVARQLMNRGIQPGSHVGVLLPRSIDAIVSILGILRAGACYVPIDVEYPESRINYMISDAGLSLLITTDDRITEYHQSVSSVTAAELLTHTESDSTLPMADPDSAAYIIYTSGSTGNPKGCVITHRQLAWYLDWTQAQYFDGITGSSVPLFTSLAFDLTVTTIFGSLISANCLTIFDETMPLNVVMESVFDPTGSTEVLKMTPAHTLLLADSGIKTTKVNRVIVGGEALLPVHVQQLLRLNPKMQIFNEYGPTETVVGCSVDVITTMDQPITIGKPVDHASMYVVDTNQSVLPVGVPGELVIGGHSVSNGYLNRDELNQSKFVTLSVNGERVYRSGDLAYLLPDGKFMFLGRTDNQVKIRGYRIELDEIRTQIQNISGVKDAFVNTSTFTDDSLHLVAYVVSHEISDEQVIKDQLSNLLPSYMIPSFVLFISDIPLTVNGKVDTRALPDLHTYIQQHSKVIRHPETELQHQLKAIWMEVLGVQDLSIDDNFFELGGHSLKAMQIVSRIQHGLKLDLLLSDFFDHLTIEQLDAHLTSKNSTKETIIPKCAEASSYPCSGPQKRLWILDKLPGAGNAYHVSGIYTLVGVLNPERFIEAISRMILRHESLRTSFTEVDQQPVQVIHANPQPLVEYIDATSIDDLDSWLEDVTKATLHGAFDLTDPSLFRSMLVKTSFDSYRWIVCMHHIISDGWSVDLMLEEIQSLYQQLIEPTTPTLSELPIQYKDYASWMGHYQQTDEYQKLEEFWISQFTDPIEPITLPFQKARPTLKSYHGASMSTMLPESTFQSVQRLHKQGFSSFITLTTALSHTLRSLLQRDEFVIGTPVAGRFLPELESLIGFFVNVVPLKINLSADSTPKESLQALRKVIMAALEHQQISFDTWTSKLTHASDPSRSPVFDVLVVYHNNPITDLHLNDLSITPIPFEEKYSKYDLVFEFTELTTGVDLRIDFNTDLFDAANIHSMASYFTQTLNAIVMSPEAPVHSLPSPPHTHATSIAPSSSPAPHPTPTTTGPSGTDVRIELLRSSWSTVLGRSDFSDTDNFFALGGDSIKAIQMSSALYQQGYKLTIATLFSYPTIRELYSQIELTSRKTDQEPISGSHPLTPIQSWLFSRDENTLNRFFQSALVRLVQPYPLSSIKSAWKQVMMHHDELRARPGTQNGHLGMDIRPSEPDFRFTHRSYHHQDVQREVTQWLETWLPDNKVHENPLCHVLVLTESTTQSRFVFIAIHHLVVDIVSWRAILEDFNHCLDAILTEASVALPNKTTSFTEWARYVEQFRKRPLMDPIRSFWKEQIPVLNRGKIEAISSNTPHTSDRVCVTGFSDLIAETLRTYQVKMNDVLAAALSRAIHRLGDQDLITITQEVHGRDSMPNESVDRTVGWFTTEFPVPVSFHADPARHLREVKESRARFEQNGRWFMLSESTEYISQIQQSSVGLNFLGDVTMGDSLSRLSLVQDTTQIDRFLESGLSLGKPVSILGYFQNTDLQLVVESQVESLRSSALASALVEELTQLTALSESDAHVNTPSDFDYDGLDIDSLDDLLNSIK